MTTYTPRAPYPPNWIELAEAVRAAANWHCENCGTQGLTPDKYEEWDSPENRPLLLEVHHKDRNPANCEPDNLTALCRRCHRKAHAAIRHKLKHAIDAPIPALA